VWGFWFLIAPGKLLATDFLYRAICRFSQLLDIYGLQRRPFLVELIFLAITKERIETTLDYSIIIMDSLFAGSVSSGRIGLIRRAFSWCRLFL
jgi:hypothetical protein